MRPRFTSPLPTGMIFLPSSDRANGRPQVALADDYQRSGGLTSMREFYRFVWRSTASRQIVLIILIILAITAAVLAMAPLELRRHIIN
jgi:hypothetical protein